MSLNLTAMVLAGRHFWWGWLVGVLAEIFWFYYGYMTQQWGFAFFAILFGAVYLRNTYKWRKKEKMSVESYDPKIEGAYQFTIHAPTYKQASDLADTAEFKVRQWNWHPDEDIWMEKNYEMDCN